ncbi:hypothetical protein VKT23_004795 [Stygiomarasmius scandens]|uniref:C2H2-type domain-containing protein n=1 Tax=Marasmiellus scandens TaxID=2682957 RepID=A0ABR1JRV3_9AGAR
MSGSVADSLDFGNFWASNRVCEWISNTSPDAYSGQATFEDQRESYQPSKGMFSLGNVFHFDQCATNTFHDNSTYVYNSDNDQWQWMDHAESESVPSLSSSRSSSRGSSPGSSRFRDLPGSCIQQDTCYEPEIKTEPITKEDRTTHAQLNPTDMLQFIDSSDFVSDDKNSDHAEDAAEFHYGYADPMSLQFSTALLQHDLDDNVNPSREDQVQIIQNGTNFAIRQEYTGVELAELFRPVLQRPQYINPQALILNPRLENPSPFSPSPVPSAEDDLACEENLPKRSPSPGQLPVLSVKVQCLENPEVRITEVLPVAEANHKITLQAECQVEPRVNLKKRKASVVSDSEYDYQSDDDEEQAITSARGRQCSVGRPTKRRRFYCSVPGCKISFTRHPDVQRHIESIHNESKDCRCDRCGKELSRLDALRRHKRTNSCRARTAKLKESAANI